MDVTRVPSTVVVGVYKQSVVPNAARVLHRCRGWLCGSNKREGAFRSISSTDRVPFIECNEPGNIAHVSIYCSEAEVAWENTDLTVGAEYPYRFHHQCLLSS